MGSVRLIALVLVALLQLPVRTPLGRGAPPSKGENVEQQIAALDDQVIQAYLKADTGFMEKYFAGAEIVEGHDQAVTNRLLQKES